MAKEANVWFVGEGVVEVMHREYPLLGKTLVFPVGEYFETLEMEREFARHGAKQRSGDFGAVSDPDKVLSDKQKQQIAYDKAIAWNEHLLAGGGWFMSKAGGLTKDLVAAVAKVSGKTEAQIRAAAKADAEQIPGWKANLEVKELVIKAQLKRTVEKAKEAPKTELVIKGL